MEPAPPPEMSSPGKYLPIFRIKKIHFFYFIFLPKGLQYVVRKDGGKWLNRITEAAGVVRRRAHYLERRRWVEVHPSGFMENDKLGEWGS